ncbi:unnamed protein product [Didymodactylos carnosus]|uniref:O-methyltransferase C-terminal domain-containing protein n=1 Tax=Didymodactylos carnosus TaxID=1234261 RepID=A0A815S6Z2_9BILA|nr:unnamed protein product [Didymodactylos carnosus]CAF4349289.1 unnamed protein product [Didymodactylos carnosus]
MRMKIITTFILTSNYVMAQNNDRIIHSPIELKGFSKYLSLIFHQLTKDAIWTFCELRIADLMTDYKLPITALELSQLNGNNWNAEFLYRLLRVNADAGIITQVTTGDENSAQPEQIIRFQLTEDGLLLTSNHFSKARDMIRLVLSPNMEKTWSYFPSLIKFGYKHGNCFEQAFGCSTFEYMKKEENKEYANAFNNGMLAYSNYTASSIVSAIDFSHFSILVDIGGGLGTLLSSIMEKYQNLHGILFDLDHVIQHAKTISPNEFQRKQIEPNRYTFVGGDMFKSETIPPADAYILKSLIHDWDDEKSIEILKSIRNANRTQTEKPITVFIVEAVIMSENKDNWEAHVMDLHMLSNLGAKERGLSGYTDLLNKSGYELKHLYKTEGLTSVIEARTATTQI